MATKKPFILLEGTPLEKKVYLENPQEPTADDLKLIQRLYGLPQGLDLKQTVDALNQLKDLGEVPSIAQAPSLDSPEKFAKDQAMKIAEVEQRMKLMDDPLNYKFNQAKDKLNFSTGPFSEFPGIGYVIPDEIRLGDAIPDQMVSKPIFGAIGGVGGLYAAKLMEGAPVAFKKYMTKKFPMLELVGSKEAKLQNKGITAETGKYLGAEALGSQFGESTYDFANEMLRYMMGLPATELKDQATQTLYDMYMNLLFTGGSAALAPVFNIFKKPIQKIFGVQPNTENFKKIKALGETYGFPMGVIQATNSGLVKGYAKVIGVFPWVGTPFRKSGEAVDEATRQYFQRTNNLMPVNTISQLGGDVRKMAEGRYESLRAAQNYLYDDFMEFAEKLGDKKVINVSLTKKQAARTFKKYDASAPRTEGGYGKFRFPGDQSRIKFGEFYDNLSRIDDNMTIDQAITLRQMFNDFMVNFKNEFGGNIPKDQAAAIAKLQDAFERDFANMMKLDSEIDDAILQQVKKKYATAVEFFADTTKNYEGGIVTDFKQMNKSMFGPGAEMPGYMYAGEAFQVIYNRAKKDPDAMKHLLTLTEPTSAEIKAYKMSGNKEGIAQKVKVMVKEQDPNNPDREINVMREKDIIGRAPGSERLIIAQRLFNDAIKDSIVGLPSGANFVDFLSVPAASLEQIQKKGLKKVSPDLLAYQNVTINAGQFAKNLGLESPDGIEVLDTLFKGTNLNVKSIKNFLQAADNAGSFVVPDPSTFVQRRVTLSGFKGILLGGAATGAGMVGAINFPTMLIVPLLLRHGSNLLTDPKALDAMTDVLETGVLTASKRSSLLQWAEKFLPDDEEAMRLDQQEQIDDAIFNLQVNPSTPMEQEQAVPEAYKKSLNRFRGMDEQEKMINERLMDIQSNQMGASLTPRFNEQQLNLASNTRMNPRLRQALAFGTLDDALAERGGIGSI